MGPMFKSVLLQACLIAALVSATRSEPADDVRRERDASVPAILLDDPVGAEAPIPAVFLDAEESVGVPVVAATIIGDEAYDSPSAPIPIADAPAPIIVDGPAPVPVVDAPAPVPVVGAPVPVPAYEPLPPPPQPTNARCSISQVDLETEICKPTVTKTCTKIKLTSKELVASEQCVKIVKTVCEKSEETVDNELCYYDYKEQDETAEGQTTSAQYDQRCENADVPGSCSKQGYGYCKKERTQLCYNEAVLDPVTVPVSVTYPIPEKVCENSQVILPKINCVDIEEDLCLPITEAQGVEEEFEKCATDLGPPACEKIVLTFPKEVCEEEIVPEYHAAPAPGYAPAAPNYAPPPPSYAPRPAPAYAG